MRRQIAQGVRPLDTKEAAQAAQAAQFKPKIIKKGVVEVPGVTLEMGEMAAAVMHYQPPAQEVGEVGKPWVSVAVVA